MTGRGRPPTQDKAAKVARDKATRARCMRALRARRKREVEEGRQSDVSDGEDNAPRKRRKVVPRPPDSIQVKNAESRSQPGPMQAQDSSDDDGPTPPPPPPPPPAPHFPPAGSLVQEALLPEGNGVVGNNGDDQAEASSSELDLTSEPGEPLGDEDRKEGDSEVQGDEEGAEEAEIPDGPNIPLFPVQYVLDPDQAVEDPLRELVNALGAVKARSNVSDAAMDKMIKVFGSRARAFADMVESGDFRLSYRKFVKPLVMEGVPKFKYAVLVDDNSTDPPTRQYVTGLDTIPNCYTHQSTEHNFTVVRQEGGTTLREIKNFHWCVARAQGLTFEQFKEHCATVDVSLDGVAESSTAKRSLYILSVRFGSSIYLWHVYNYTCGMNAKPDVNEVLSHVVDEFALDNELTLRFVIGDCPERHFVRNIVSHSGKQSCEVCIGEAVTNPIHWPFEGSYGKRERTHEELKYISEHLQEPGVNPRGVKGSTPLYRLPPGFDIIFSVPLDEFHLVKEGIAKLIVKRLFEDQSTMESRDIFDTWNAAYQNTAVLSEIPRCAHDISTGKLKGSEFTVLIHATFPYLVDVMRWRMLPLWQHARVGIAVFTFLIKAYNQSNAVLEEIEDILGETRRGGGHLSLDALHRIFYSDFEKGFCHKDYHRAVSNVHCFSHLGRMRKETGVPLYETTTEPFESLYSVVRRAYHSGTRNIPRQILENGYLRVRNISYHGRERGITVRTATKSTRVRDSIILTKQGQLAEVISDETPFRAHPLVTSEYNPHIGFKLPWAKVGVFRYEGLNYEETILVEKKDIVGKGIVCGGLVTTWLKEWSLSKYDD